MSLNYRDSCCEELKDYVDFVYTQVASIQDPELVVLNARVDVLETEVGAINL